MIDNRTPHLNLPLPHPDNVLEDDVTRLRGALTQIDTALNNAATEDTNVLNAAVAADADVLAAAIAADAIVAANATAADAAVLAAANAHADGLVVGLWDDRGSFNASVNTYPTTGGSGASGAILKGDIWTVSVIATAGPLLGFAVGATVRALVDAPGQTGANWSRLSVGIGYVPENTASKDASNGYAGLTAFKLNLRNAANTITSWFTTAATAARTWTMPDKDGTVAMTSDITGTNSGTNTGDETTASIKTKLGIVTLSGSNTGDQTSVSGNAGTATALQTARTIDGQSFDGTANITITAPAMHAAASKATPVDADEFGYVDSEASNVIKKTTWSSIKAALKAYFDGIFGIVRQNSQSAAYTTVLADAGKHIYHPSADTTARTWTIDSNANVAYPIGTAITFVNDTSAGVITIAITADTLVLAGTGATGNRTLAANGMATALKTTATRWMISGSGLT